MPALLPTFHFGQVHGNPHLKALETVIKNLQRIGRIMGAVFAVVGLTDSFYWVGGTLLALSLGLCAISRPPAST
jgi:hypothetical protein